MFLVIKSSFEQKNYSAKSFFVLEMNSLQVFDDVTDE